MNENVSMQRKALELLREQSVEYLKKETDPHPYTMIAGTTHRIRLLRFFAKYNMSRLDDVDLLLHRWATMEEAMWVVLLAKYGPEPLPPASHETTVEAPAEMTFEPKTLKERIYAMYHKFNPSKLSEVPEVMKKYEGHEMALLRALVKKYGNEPHILAQQVKDGTVKVVTYRDRLEDMYKKYEPKKLREMESLLARFPGQERKLLSTMVLKFGKEPKGPYPEEPEEEIKPLSTRDRLRGFFMHHDRSQLSIVDSALQRFHNDEDEMFSVLTARYGPEPTRKQIEMLLHPSTLQIESAILGANAAALDNDHRFQKRVDKSKELFDAAIKKGGFDEAPDSAFAAHLNKYFTLFEPDLHGSTSHFVKAFTATERNELAEYIRYHYKTAEPVEHNCKFQEQLHYLHMVYKCEEVTEVGGIQAYARIIPHDRYSIVLHELQRKYGPVPTMKFVAMRNRLKRFFVAFNPQNVADVDRIIEKFTGEEQTLYKALEQKFGDEPPLPEDIDHKRIINFLRFRAPALMPALMLQDDEIIDAHCAPGAGSVAVMKALEESFGAEPTKADIMFMDSQVKIMLQQCRTGTNEIQLRDLLQRKEHQDRLALQERERELEAIADRVVKPATAKGLNLSKFKKVVKKVGDYITILTPSSVLENKKAEQEEAKLEVLKKVAKLVSGEEEAARLQMVQAEYDIRYRIVSDRDSMVDATHGLKTLPMLELIKRQAWEEDCSTEWNAVMKEFAQDVVEIDRSLRSRLVWRERWEEWEIYKAAKSMKDHVAAIEEAQQKDDREADMQATAARQQFEREKRFARDMEAMQCLLDDQNNRVVKYEADLMRARRRVRGSCEVIHLPIAQTGKATPVHPYHKGHCTLPRLNVKYDNIAVLCPVRGISMYRDLVRLVTHDDYEPPVVALDSAVVRMAKGAEADTAFRANCREYLVNILSEYAPKRLMEVDTMMGRFAGREEELMSAMEQQYGVLKDDPNIDDVSMMNTTEVQAANLRDRLVTFFEKYDPSLVEIVNNVLREWEGREEKMWAMLEKTYGPANLQQREVTMEEGRALLITYYELRSPQLVADVDYIIREYEGNFNLLDVMLKKKYGSGFLS